MKFNLSRFDNASVLPSGQGIAFGIWLHNQISAMIHEISYKAGYNIHLGGLVLQMTWSHDGDDDSGIIQMIMQMH